MCKNYVNFNHFKSLRNKAQCAIGKAKLIFFTDTLKHNKNDSKSLWKSLKDLGLSFKGGKSSSHTNISLKIEKINVLIKILLL